MVAGYLPGNFKHNTDGWQGTTVDVDATTGQAHVPYGRQAVDKAGTWAKDAKGFANQWMNEASQKAGPWAQNAQQTAGNWARNAQQNAGPWAQGARETAGNWAQGARETAGNSGGFGKTLGAIGKHAGGAANVLFAGLDYAQGKAEGEDNIRAAAGAIGSGGGGWAGAGAGAAIGSVAGPIGTVVGGLIGGAVGSMAGGWGADRVDDMARGSAASRGDMNSSPTTRGGMLLGAAQKVRGEEDMNLGGFGKALGTVGVGAGLVGAGYAAKSATSQPNGMNNEFAQRQQMYQGQLTDSMGNNIDQDVQQGIYVGERAGRFKRDLERDQMSQQYQNQLGLQTQQLQSSDSQHALDSFIAAKNSAAGRAATILNTRFY